MVFSRFTSRGDRHSILLRILLLRAFAIATSLCVLLVFQFYLGRVLAYPLLYGVIAVATGYSIYAFFRLPRVYLISDLELAVHLLLDGAIVVLLVAFSGRAANPFIYYLLVLVAIAATIFPRWLAWLFSSLAVVSYSFLLFLDLAEHVHHLFSDFQLHLVGMWVNFVGSAVLLTLFISALATALRDREIRLAREREKALQSEQLIAIGTLAASTAHALGTPLSTMAVVLGELRADNESDDLSILQTQVDRCKRTLAQLAKLADTEPVMEEVTLAGLFDELHQHYLLMSPAHVPEFELPDLLAATGVTRTRLLVPAMINIIDNAVRAARERVHVSAVRGDDTLRILVADDGEGLSAERQRQFGKLGVTSSAGGLGLGVFLANTTLEQLGGRIVLHNANSVGGTLTVVAIELPLIDHDNP